MTRWLTRKAIRRPRRQTLVWVGPWACEEPGTFPQDPGLFLPGVLGRPRMPPLVDVTRARAVRALGRSPPWVTVEADLLMGLTRDSLCNGTFATACCGAGCGRPGFAVAIVVGASVGACVRPGEIELAHRTPGFAAGGGDGLAHWRNGLRFGAWRISGCSRKSWGFSVAGGSFPSG
jgi:hypothetical protein